MIDPIVDRTLEDIEGDAEVSVILPCGFSVRFWLTGLSNEECIKRTQEIKRLEESDENGGKQ